MKWSKQFPSVKGYHWMRSNGLMTIVRIDYDWWFDEDDHADEMSVYVFGNELPYYIGDPGEGFEWAGPILPPA